MKIRNGFVSNSSTSSFIISYERSKEDIMKKVNEFLDNVIIKEEKEITEYYTKNRKKYNLDTEEKLQEFIKKQVDYYKDKYNKENREKYISLCKVSELTDFDIRDYFNPKYYCDVDWVLYDHDDNYINWIEEEINEEFNCQAYNTHMG